MTVCLANVLWASYRRWYRKWQKKPCGYWDDLCIRVANVENAVNKLDGVDKAVVNLTTEKCLWITLGIRLVQKRLKSCDWRWLRSRSLQSRYSQKPGRAWRRQDSQGAWATYLVVGLSPFLFYLAMGPMVGLTWAKLLVSLTMLPWLMPWCC